MGSALITGGAGFIGVNLAKRLLHEGHQVTIFDNLSRPGCLRRLEWLESREKNDDWELQEGDVTEAALVDHVVQGKDRIYHLAGQVAVTTSVAKPRKDFLENALGTINVLEGARKLAPDAIFLLSSTNKVYGDIELDSISEKDSRYVLPSELGGIDENHPLDFYSPYGCSKGAADQYVRDYWRVYGLKTLVMRQSCIYGPWQFGSEDQGWLAWFMVAALTGRKITIYGNGKQVRDVLFIDDLLDAYEAAISRIDLAAGEVFNIGGGKMNSLSVWKEFGPLLEQWVGRRISVEERSRRRGDQKIYISDCDKARRLLGWHPKTDRDQGLKIFFDWLVENRKLVESVVEEQ